jgi:hypothetical protein
MSSADRRWWRRYDRYLNSQGWQLVICNSDIGIGLRYHEARSKVSFG